MAGELTRLASPYKGGRTSSDTIVMESRQIGGRHVLTRSAAQEISSLDRRRIAILRRILWDMAQAGASQTIVAPVRTYTDQFTEPSFVEKSLDILRCIKNRAIRLGEGVKIFDPNAEDRLELELSTIVVMENDAGSELQYYQEGELPFYLQYLEGRGFISYNRNPTGGVSWLRIQPVGLIYLEETESVRTQSEQGFVAMWFDPRMDGAWLNAAKPAIERAGYKAFRVDRHEHVNRIDDEILAQIRKSRFLISDFSSEPGKPRGGVYFEAGFALGLGLPVIWTAKEELKSEIHFDIRQYNTIFWKNEEELQNALYNRIVALLGVGPATQ